MDSAIYLCGYFCRAALPYDTGAQRADDRVTSRNESGDVE